MKPLFEIFDAENEKLLASQEIKKNLHKIDAEGASVVVQLSSGDVKGNAFRALRPGDTELVVGVYSVNEKGNLAVLTGLGKEPVAVISTIFDIVKACVTKNKTIETIVFRLNKRALKGKEKLLQRIIQKLVKARFGSRFEIKDEFIDVSPAMSFIVAQKRNADELDPEDFVEKQEKVKDQMVVKQLGLDFDKPEGDAVESELTSYKGATISYGENHTIINFSKNYSPEIFQDAIGKLKAKNPSLSFRYDQNSLTIGAHLSREQTIEVCETVFESDKENFNRLLNLKSKPNFDLGNDQPNKKQNIKLARKLALDEIKSYADANKFKKATLSKYKYIDIIGSHSTHSNNQVLIGITLDSGTTIPEYRDEEKCSGWIATDNRKIDSNTITDVATDIKYRLQQEGFNVSMTSKNWYRYLESDDFVIVVALDFPKKSDRFETSGNTYVNMISAYLYNKLTNKVHLLSDSAGVASDKAQDINKTIADLVKSKTVNVDKLPAEDFIAKELEPKVDLKSIVQVNRSKQLADGTTVHYGKTNRGLDVSIKQNGENAQITWPELFYYNAHDVIDSIPNAKAFKLSAVMKDALKANVTVDKVKAVVDAVDKVAYIHASNMVDNNLYGDFAKEDIELLKRYGKFRLFKGKKNAGKFIIDNDDHDITVEFVKDIGGIALIVDEVSKETVAELKSKGLDINYSQLHSGNYKVFVEDFSEKDIEILVNSLRGPSGLTESGQKAKSLFDIAKTILEQNMHEDTEFLKKTYQ